MEAVKVGLAGIGRAGWGMHSPAMEERSDKFSIVAACDVEEGRCAKMAERYGCRTYPDIRDLVEDDEVELVSIATRSPDHVEHGILALRAGKNVFLEKPIALHYDNAKRLVDEAEISDAELYFRHNRRFEPAFQHVREIVDSGLLGEVYEVKLRRHHYARRDDWQTLIECGGGQLNNWGPHIIDHALRFLDSPVDDIWSDLRLVAAVGDAEDHLKICLRGDNDRVVDLEISGGAAISEPEYIVFGRRGALRCDGSEIEMRYLDPHTELPERSASPESPPLEGGFGSSEELPWVEKTVAVSPEHDVETEDIWDYLYGAIREGEEFPITHEQALEVVRVTTEVKRGTPFERSAG
ncbi:MAG: Gfo/Idh/MocA family protein [Planctomycetota bacterium]